MPLACSHTCPPLVVTGEGEDRLWGTSVANAGVPKQCPLVWVSPALSRPRQAEARLELLLLQTDTEGVVAPVAMAGPTLWGAGQEQGSQRPPQGPVPSCGDGVWLGGELWRWRVHTQPLAGGHRLSSGPLQGGSLPAEDMGLAHPEGPWRQALPAQA